VCVRVRACACVWSRNLNNEAVLGTSWDIIKLCAFSLPSIKDRYG